MMHGQAGSVHAGAPRLGAPMLRKLGLRSAFTDREREALLALPVDEHRFASRDTIVRAGDTPSRCCLLIDGCAGSFKVLPDGARQIISLHIAGDVIDLQSTVLAVADHGIAAVGPGRVAYLSNRAIREASDRFPGIARAFWQETLLDGSIAREWLLNIGRRDAYGRLAHLFCEMRVRTAAVGLDRNGSFAFPLTQAELGDATALTPVHVNRTLRKIRADGLVSTRANELRVEDWDRLAAAASFDPAYLHLPN